jgi:hypothetical protein
VAKRAGGGSDKGESSRIEEIAKGRTTHVVRPFRGYEPRYGVGTCRRLGISLPTSPEARRPMIETLVSRAYPESSLDTALRAYSGRSGTRATLRPPPLLSEFRRVQAQLRRTLPSIHHGSSPRHSGQADLADHRQDLTRCNTRTHSCICLVSRVGPLTEIPGEGQEICEVDITIPVQIAGRIEPGLADR